VGTLRVRPKRLHFYRRRSGEPTKAHAGRAVELALGHRTAGNRASYLGERSEKKRHHPEGLSLGSR
jgi:hypothetical protein